MSIRSIVSLILPLFLLLPFPASIPYPHHAEHVLLLFAPTNFLPKRKTAGKNARTDRPPPASLTIHNSTLISLQKDGVEAKRLGQIRLPPASFAKIKGSCLLIRPFGPTAFVGNVLLWITT